jgi:membrane fusion protein, multidrug efflux system
MKKILLGTSLGLTLTAGLGLYKFLEISAAIEEGKKHGPPPQAVTSLIATSEEWPRTITAVASLTAIRGAMLSAEQPGNVDAVKVESGTLVKAGDLLLSLDTKVERAQLAGAQSELELAETTLSRQRLLRDKNATAQSTLDTAEASARNLRAEVARLKAVIQQKQIIAPFDGKVGIRKVSLGQMVNMDTPIIEVVSTDGLYVDFVVPQRDAASVQPGLSVKVKAEGQEEAVTAEVTAVGSMVDSVARTLSVQATIKQAPESFKPGMFAEATVLLPTTDKVVAVPISSVSFSPFGNSVYEIGAETPDKSPREITSRSVALGRRVGDQIAVLSGLQAGAEIISSGTFKIFPGAKAIVNNAATPDNLASPTPADS